MLKHKRNKYSSEIDIALLLRKEEFVSFSVHGNLIKKKLKLVRIFEIS